MPIFFDEDKLTEEQRARYDWALAEYARIQQQNRMHLEHVGQPAVDYKISPKSALFARLLDGKLPLPYPPPTSHSYPWYDVIEKPGPHPVSLGGGLTMRERTNWHGGAPTDEHLVLNQCSWRILRKNQAAAQFLACLRQADQQRNDSEILSLLRPLLTQQPELIVTYGQWGEFKLYLGRIMRRGRRESVNRSQFDLSTLDGGNPVILKVLVAGADMHAKSEATLATLRNKHQSESEMTSFEKITLAAESAIPRSVNPVDDDLVEYDCDGWLLQKL